MHEMEGREKIKSKLLNKLNSSKDLEKITLCPLKKALNKQNPGNKNKTAKTFAISI